MAIKPRQPAPRLEVKQLDGTAWRLQDAKPEKFSMIVVYRGLHCPVCKAYLGELETKLPEFAKRGVKPIGLSVDPLKDHEGWSKDIEETQGTALNFPLIADPDREVSLQYDMIHPNADATLTVRSVFVIDSDKKVRLTLTYPASTGRNFDEILRAIDSLKLTSEYQVATPVNWKHGEKVIIVPTVTNEQARRRHTTLPVMARMT